MQITQNFICIEFPALIMIFCNELLITFLKQGQNHPNPGQPYHPYGFPRVAYLPDNTKGKKVCCNINSKLLVQTRLMRSHKAQQNLNTLWIAKVRWFEEVTFLNFFSLLDFYVSLWLHKLRGFFQVDMSPISLMRLHILHS